MRLDIGHQSHNNTFNMRATSLTWRKKGLGKNRGNGIMLRDGHSSPH